MSGLASKWATDETLVQKAYEQDSKVTHKPSGLEESKWSKPIVNKKSDRLASKWADAEEEEEEKEEPPKKVEVPKGPRNHKPPRTPKGPKKNRDDYPTPPSSAESNLNPLAQRLDMLRVDNEIPIRDSNDKKLNDRSKNSQHHNHADKQNHNRQHHNRDHQKQNHNLFNKTTHKKDRRESVEHEQVDIVKLREKEAEEKQRLDKEQEELLKKIDEWKSQDIDWADF
ncbi:hypothetical protein SBY92_004135 [Candida maltosa Xu316]